MTKLRGGRVGSDIEERCYLVMFATFNNGHDKYLPIAFRQKIDCGLELFE
jgi:hypothetical protein